MYSVDDMANITNEGLAIEIKNLAVQITELKATLQSNSANYVTHEVFKLQLEAVHARIDTVKQESRESTQIIQSEIKSLNKRRWVQNTLSAILGAVLAILVSFFLLNVGGK